jgi:Asp-tRNA(Asn)/Glu-tRNA(Gln) amidotransferase A subunit family amidase
MKSFKSWVSEIESAKQDNKLKKLFSDYFERLVDLNQKYAMFEYLDETNFHDQVSKIENIGDPNTKKLYGIPVGIKDIINTEDLPTSMGSQIWRDFRPGNNARVVDLIKNEAGIVAGKTVTAEFAVHHLQFGRVINPLDKERIVGTSSSGSAVAVASGAVPIALGTQTAGSIMRPASYCGVFGFKPTFGAIDRTGILKTTDTLDQVGIIGCDLNAVYAGFSSLLRINRDYPYSKKYSENWIDFKNNRNKPRVKFLESEFNAYLQFDQDCKETFEEIKTTIKNDTKISTVENLFDLDLNRVHPLHEIIYNKSLSYYFSNEFKNRDLISENISKMMSKGDSISSEDYIEALKLQSDFIKIINEEFENFDFVLIPTTAGVAPREDEVEKEDSSILWSFFGLPALTLPVRNSNSINLPFGLQVISRKYNDFALIQFSNTLVKILDRAIF